MQLRYFYQPSASSFFSYSLNFLAMKRLLPLLWLIGTVISMEAQTWTGNISSNWNTNQNWSPASIPLSGSNVVIPGTISGTHWPVLPGDLTINSINMGAGSRIDFAGHSLTLQGNSAYQNIIGAILNNSVPANQIVINMQGGDGGWTRVFRGNTINGNIEFNISGPANFQEADVGSSGNQYNGNVTFNIATDATVYLCYASKSVFGGHLTISRTGAGYTSAFNAGAGIAGNFSFVNLAGGEAFFGNVANRTTIGGTINMQVDYPALSNFKVHRLINQTSGGTLQIQNTAGFEMLNDTLLLAQLSVTGYREGYGIMYNNKINGNIIIADHATNANGWTTLMRSNVFTGNTSVTINGINTFLEADIPGSGNVFNGNTSFVSNQSAILYISNGDKSTYNKLLFPEQFRRSYISRTYK